MNKRILKFRLIKDGKIVGYERHRKIKMKPYDSIIEKVIIEYSRVVNFVIEEDICKITHDDKEQFIGLHDKNEKEGYHHDICRGEDNRIFEIVWYSNGWEKYYRKPPLNYEGMPQEYWQLTDLFRYDEIIGNSVENPKLLVNY